MPKRSSKDSVLETGCSSCSSKARAMPSSLSCFKRGRVCCVNIESPSGGEWLVVIIGATDVVVRGKQVHLLVCIDGVGFSLEPRFEDRGDAFVAWRSDRERPPASGFEPFRRVFLGKAQEAEAGAVTLLRMRPALELPLDDIPRRRTNRHGPIQKPPRRPFPMRLMGFRHVLGRRRMFAALIAFGVAGDSFTVGPTFDRGAGDAYVDLLANQWMRHTVVMAIYFDVVIERHGREFPLGVFEGGGR